MFLLVHVSRVCLPDLIQDSYVLARLRCKKDKAKVLDEGGGFALGGGVVWFVTCCMTWKTKSFGLFLVNLLGK